MMFTFLYQFCGYTKMLQSTGTVQQACAIKNGVRGPEHGGPRSIAGDVHPALEIGVYSATSIILALV